MTDGFVSIAAYDNVYDAHIAKSTLEEAGISVFLQDAETVGLNWELTYALGGVRILVPSEDVERAKDILAKANAAADKGANQSTNTSGTITCLDCGHDIPAGSDKCPKCGWTYLE